MDMPYALRAAIEAAAEPYDLHTLSECAAELSRRYTKQSGTGSRLLTGDAEAAAYCVMRMPATFGAVSAALSYALECTSLRPDTLLDVGTGTGAAIWAAANQLDLRRIACLEREPAMRRLGVQLADAGETPLRDAEWIDGDVSSIAPLPRAALVTEAYMLNELTEPARLAAAERLWNAAEDMLLLVEPGTPAASGQLRRVRDRLLSLGARVAAPCPSQEPCPMADDDWCHFQCRVARSRLHKRLKGGDAPYEDEKFSFLALVREAPFPAPCRVLRVPYAEKGRITLTMCDGERVRTAFVTKKSPDFKAARKLECGDAFSPKGEIS